MDFISWAHMSQAIATLGFEVDLITDARKDLPHGPHGFRCVSFRGAKWSGYDGAIGFKQAGFQTLRKEAGRALPPVVSLLTSVVGRTDDVPGVYFFGEARRRLYEAQQQIQATSQCVVMQTESNRELWDQEFGGGDKVVMIPSATDRVIPPPGANPFGGFREKIAIYIGHLYYREQRAVNLDWQHRLNRLGAALGRRRIRLFFLGPGYVDEIDDQAVTVLGRVPNERVWDYQYFADVGVVLAQGPVQRNESAKIYYYLRTGLPVVSEAPVPNNHVIQEANAGLIVEYGNEDLLADAIHEVVHSKWDHEGAIRYILDHHTYEHRAPLFQRAILSVTR